MVLNLSRAVLRFATSLTTSKAGVLSDNGLSLDSFSKDTGYSLSPGIRACTLYDTSRVETLP